MVDLGQTHFVQSVILELVIVRSLDCSDMFCNVSLCGAFCSSKVLFLSIGLMIFTEILTGTMYFP
jgi:hypothetical protein